MTKLSVAAFLLILSPFATVASAANYDIDVKLNTALAYEAIQLSVDYSATPGNISGGGSAASCTTTLNAASKFNNCDTASYPGCASTTKKLKSGQIDTAGFTGPVVLYTCRWAGSSAPQASQFVISLVDWSASHTTTPTFSISRIQLVP